jgi:hypothetical protein
VVDYLVINMPPEGVNLGAEIQSPAGVLGGGSGTGLVFTDYTRLDAAFPSGSFELERGSEAPEPGTWKLLLTVGTWSDNLEVIVLFTVL